MDGKNAGNANFRGSTNKKNPIKLMMEFGVAQKSQSPNELKAFAKRRIVDDSSPSIVSETA